MDIRASSIAYRGPCYAVKFLNEEHVVVGLGNHLFLFRTTDGGMIKEIVIVEENFLAIHMIEIVSKNLLVVGGQRNIAIVEFYTAEESEEKDSIVHHVLERNDWIMDMKYFSNYLVVGYSHNFVELWDIKTSPKLVKLYKGESNIFLYSMKIGILPQSEDEFEVLVASSVVFDIHLWKIKSDGTIAKLCVLKGHKGVIYRIDIHQNLLASVSDDRHIILWRMNESMDTLVTKTSLIGHLSRPWDVKIVPTSGTAMKIVSSGQDGTVRIWSDIGEMERILKSHIQQHIWRIDCCLDASSLLIASTGDDSSVKLHRHMLNSPLSNITSHVLPPDTFGLAQLCGNSTCIYCYDPKTKNIVKIERNSSPSKFHFFKIPFRDIDTNKVKKIKVSDDFMLASCGKFSECFVFAINSGEGGHDKLLCSFVLESLSDGKRRVVDDIFIMDLDSTNDTLEFSVGCTRGILSFYRLRKRRNIENFEEEEECGEDGAVEIDMVGIGVKKNPGMVPVTCVARHCKNKSVVVAGDRRGRVLIFNLGSGEDEPVGMLESTRKCSFRSVTTVQGEASDLFYFTTTRTQSIHVYSVDSEGGRVQLLQRIKTSDFVQQNKKLVVLSRKNSVFEYPDILSFGFVGNYFVGVNISRFYRYFSSKQKIKRKATDLYVCPSQGSDHGSLHYTFLNKKNEICEAKFSYFSKDNPLEISLLESVPIRQIYDCCSFVFLDIVYFCVCSESRFLMMFKVLSNCSFTKVWYDERDNPMKFVKMAECGSHSYLFSGGGKEEMVIYKLLSGKGSNGKIMVKEIFCRNLNLEDDMNYRLTSIYIQPLDLLEIENSLDRFLVFLGTSSAEVKIFQVTIDPTIDEVIVFQKIKVPRLDHSGVINCLSGKVGKVGNGMFSVELFSGSSDSKVLHTSIVFGLVKEKEKEYLADVECLDCKMKDLNFVEAEQRSKKAKNMLVSNMKSSLIQRVRACDLYGDFLGYCGDDQSMCIKSIDGFEKHSILKNIHASSVTGFKFINEVFFVTCGDDQRVNLFEIVRKEKDSGGIKLAYRKSWMSCVTHCENIGVVLKTTFEKLMTGYILVVGNGFEILEFSIQKD